MPKAIELTVEINVQKVSCPGVWICQDGRVSLTVFALGTSYQTCSLPPVFPLLFKDVFYFRKRFTENCALSNVYCLLREETIYCELVQWTNDCDSGTCLILAQYLGSLNDLLFPSNVCSTDGVDLLMRRSPDFPGILSPKIEISTKMRIDEVWNSNQKSTPSNPCTCNPDDVSRQKQACHTAQYHRSNCQTDKGPVNPRSRLRARSVGSRSYCSLTQKDRSVYCSYPRMNDDEQLELDAQERLNKTLLECRYIEPHEPHEPTNNNKCRINKYGLHNQSFAPCVCEICKKYHEMFHTGNTYS